MKSPFSKLNFIFVNAFVFFLGASAFDVNQATSLKEKERERERERERQRKRDSERKACF